MTTGRHLMLVYGLPAAILLLGGALLVWPTWQERRELQDEIEDLQTRMAGVSDQTEVVAQLASELDEVREYVSDELKVIGTDAGIAEIIARLSLPSDDVRVLSQGFSRGTMRPATNDEDETLMAMPLTIEMEATFDSIFAVVRAAESMSRLVRVTSVQISPRPAAKDVPGSPVLQATISLDSIFEPPLEEGS